MGTTREDLTNRINGYNRTNYGRFSINSKGTDNWSCYGNERSVKCQIVNNCHEDNRTHIWNLPKHAIYRELSV